MEVVGIREQSSKVAGHLFFRLYILSHWIYSAFVLSE
jgi:hypothetical protein